MNRRTLAVALSILAALSLSLPVAAGPRRIVRDSFTARALPLPNPSVYWDWEGLCLGREGVDRVEHRFVPPFDGEFTGSITSPLGGWTLTVEEVLPEGTERSVTRLAVARTTRQYPISSIASLPLRKGQAVDLVACNSGGAPEAEVAYEFRERPFRERPAPRRRVKHVETGFYSHPLAGTVAPVRHEFICLGACVDFEVRRTDRYVTDVTIDDAGSDEVAVIVYQAGRGGAYDERIFCHGVDKPIELMARASVVGVSPVSGPCTDGSVSVATGGAVTITLSSHPEARE